MLPQKKYELLAIGHLNHDYIINIQEFAGLNASQTVDELKTYDGGTAANVALVAAEFIPSAFYTIVGKDFEQSDYFKKLKNHDNCLAILERINDKTSTCFVITDSKSNQKSYIYNGAADKFPYLEPPKQFIDKAKMIHITTVPPKFAIKCAKYAYENDVIVSFDPGQNLRLYTKEEILEMLQYTRFLFGNEHEIKHISNDLNIDFFSNTKLDYLITTEGERGSVIECAFTPEQFLIPAYKTNAVDPTGAGDSYRGAFLASYLQGERLIDCGNIASATASFVVEKHGCQTNIPTKEQVEERIKNAKRSA